MRLCRHCPTLTATRHYAGIGLGRGGAPFVWANRCQQFSPELPAFLRANGGGSDIGEWALEPDRVKGGGNIHDTTRDPAHTVLVDDAGRIMGGPTLRRCRRRAPNTETALRSAR